MNLRLPVAVLAATLLSLSACACAKSRPTEAPAKQKVNTQLKPGGEAPTEPDRPNIITASGPNSASSEAQRVAQQQALDLVRSLGAKPLEFSIKAPPERAVNKDYVAYSNTTKTQGLHVRSRLSFDPPGPHAGLSKEALAKRFDVASLTISLGKPGQRWSVVLNSDMAFRSGDKAVEIVGVEGGKLKMRVSTTVTQIWGHDTDGPMDTAASPTTSFLYKGLSIPLTVHFELPLQAAATP